MIFLPSYSMNIPFCQPFYDLPKIFYPFDVSWQNLILIVSAGDEKFLSFLSKPHELVHGIIDHHICIRVELFLCIHLADAKFLELSDSPFLVCGTDAALADHLPQF